MNKAVALHPLVNGLIDELPRPGTEWNGDARVKWLRAAASVLDLLYGDADEAPINVRTHNAHPAES